MRENEHSEIRVGQTPPLLRWRSHFAVHDQKDTESIRSIHTDVGWFEPGFLLKEGFEFEVIKSHAIS